MTELLHDILDILQACAIDYMVVGSVSSSLHGQARATQDLDVVVRIDQEQLQRLLAHLPEDRYYVSAAAADEAVRRRTQFNLIDLRGGGKIDLLPLKHRDFSLQEFERRREIEGLGRTLFVATPEDVILAKLEWSSNTPSERQLRDVAGIFSTQGDRLDIAYLKKWAHNLGVSDLLQKLLERR